MTCHASCVSVIAPNGAHLIYLSAKHIEQYCTILNTNFSQVTEDLYLRVLEPPVINDNSTR